MEPQPGVFVSSLSAEEWEPDPDVGGQMHVLCETPDAWAGFTRYDSDPDPVHWTPPQHETFMVIEGAARIEITNGATLDLHAGDIATLPAGTVTTWHITAPYNEFWVLTGPSIEPDAP